MVSSPTKMANKASLKQIRKDAEKCMSGGDYVGAFVRWSHAIAGAGPEENAHFLSQRSKCLLKIGNFYYAMEDAKRVAELEPGKHHISH